MIASRTWDSDEPATVNRFSPVIGERAEKAWLPVPSYPVAPQARSAL
jgi:hypothetical protein